MDGRTPRFYIIISSALLVLGYLALWFVFPPIISKFGGFNIMSFSLTVFLIMSIVLIFMYLFRYGQGESLGRWRLNITLTCALLTFEIFLAFLYDLLLTPFVPAFWRYFILPLATMVAVFYILRSVQKIKEKIDKLSQEL